MREVDQPGGGDELSSPYVGKDEELQLAQWVRDALALALPGAAHLPRGVPGLCGQCGAT